MQVIQLTPALWSMVAKVIPNTLAAVFSASPAHWTTASRPQGKWKYCGVEQWRGGSPTVSDYRLKQASRQCSTTSAHCLTLQDGPFPPAPSCHCPLQHPNRWQKLEEIRDIAICINRCTCVTQDDKDVFKLNARCQTVFSQASALANTLTVY